MWALVPTNQGQRCGKRAGGHLIKENEMYEEKRHDWLLRQRVDNRLGRAIDEKMPPAEFAKQLALTGTPTPAIEEILSAYLELRKQAIWAGWKEELVSSR